MSAEAQRPPHDTHGTRRIGRKLIIGVDRLDY